MAITIREEQDAGSNTAGISFTTGAGMLTTDKLLLVQCNDFYTAANMTTPTGTAGSSWTLQATVDNGTNNTHMKVWTSDVASAGAQTVVVNNSTTDEERYAALFVLTGTASGIDGVASTASGASSTSHVAPSVTPTSGQSDDLLICVWASSRSVPNEGSGPVNYTLPGSMIAYTERDMGIYITYRAGSELLSSSGATGTRTATASPASTFQTVSVLVKSASAASPAPTRPVVAPSYAAIRASSW